MLLREDWLETLNLEVPQTLDDFYLSLIQILYLFEAPIDMLSFISMFKHCWKSQSLSLIQISMCIRDSRYTAPFLGARSYMALREQNMQVSGELKNLTAEPDLEGNGSPCMSMG